MVFSSRLVLDPSRRRCKTARQTNAGSDGDGFASPANTAARTTTSASISLINPRRHPSGPSSKKPGQDLRQSPQGTGRGIPPDEVTGSSSSRTRPNPVESPLNLTKPKLSRFNHLNNDDDVDDDNDDVINAAHRSSSSDSESSPKQPPRHFRSTVEASFPPTTYSGDPPTPEASCGRGRLPPPQIRRDYRGGDPPYQALLPVKLSTLPAPPPPPPSTPHADYIGGLYLNYIGLSCSSASLSSSSSSSASSSADAMPPIGAGMNLADRVTFPSPSFRRISVILLTLL